MPIEICRKTPMPIEIWQKITTLGESRQKNRRRPKCCC